MLLFISRYNNTLIVRALVLLLVCPIVLTACATNHINKLDLGDADDDQVALTLDYLSGVGTNKQKLADAIADLQELAKHGNTAAANILGYMYLSGTVIKQDYQLARSWYEKAAQAGNPSANYNLGLLYQYGWGTAPDPAASAYYFERAKILGFSQ